MSTTADPRGPRLSTAGHGVKDVSGTRPALPAPVYRNPGLAKDTVQQRPGDMQGLGDGLLQPQWGYAQLLLLLRGPQCLECRTELEHKVRGKRCGRAAGPEGWGGGGQALT